MGADDSGCNKHQCRENTPQFCTQSQQEADIVVVDRTTDKSAWKEARIAVASRVQRAFGEFTVAGHVIGEGNPGSVIVLPIGANTNITQKISVLDSSNLTDLRKGIIGENQSSRAENIYTQILSGSNANSLWSHLVLKYIAGKSGNLSSSVCESEASNYIKTQRGDGGEFSKALDYISEKMNESQLSISLCNEVVSISSNLHTIDSKMGSTSGSCNWKSGDTCSDILGSTKTINIILNDLHRKEGVHGDTLTNLNGCVLYASDMVQIGPDGPLPIKQWTTEEASQHGAADESKFIGNQFPELLAGKEVYMPYLGTTTPGVPPRPADDIEALNAYWKAFFESAGAEIRTGSASSACSGTEDRISN